MTMKIVISPDSFKGSISAIELCKAIERGVRGVLPTANVIRIPLADGGEGTVENLVEATGGTLVVADAVDPLNRTTSAIYGVLGDGETAVIEVASVSGLTLISEDERNPLKTTSYGTGQLIKHALDNGYRRFIIGLGGSATNDAGIGILRALGMEFYDEQHVPILDGGEGIGNLAFIDESNLDPRIKESTFQVACDVTNPLCGENGASAIFGPQKGATETMVQELDANLNHFADIVLKEKGTEVRQIVGGGAAGGIGAALVTFFQGKLESGIDITMNVVNYEAQLNDADIVITGEGKIDSQTLSGKVIQGVCKRATRKAVPVIALCGQLDLKDDDLKKLGVSAAFSIVNKPCSLDVAMANTAEWAEQAMKNIMGVFILGNK